MIYDVKDDPILQVSGQEPWTSSKSPRDHFQNLIRSICSFWQSWSSRLNLTLPRSIIYASDLEGHSGWPRGQHSTFFFLNGICWPLGHSEWPPRSNVQKVDQGGAKFSWLDQLCQKLRIDLIKFWKWSLGDMEEIQGSWPETGGMGSS